MTELLAKIMLKQNGGNLVTLVGVYGSKKQTIKFVIDLALDLSETCEDRVVDQVTGSRPVAKKSPGSTPFPSMWALWYTKWHCNVFLSEYFGLTLSASFRQCSILIRLSPML